MTRALLAAQSGWGKSWLTQWWTEDNLSRFYRVLILDYKDEYRGLAKAGLADWAGIGHTESQLSVEDWREIIEDNGHMILARSVPDDAWQEFTVKIARIARSMPQSILMVIDEAHFVAPQRETVPDPLTGLATTGRGEGVASAWVTQRLSELEETIIAQADVRLLGGFTSDSDLDKIGAVVPYDQQVHNALKDRVGRDLPDSLKIDGEPRSLRKFTDVDGNTVGSEWAYSNSEGDVKRIDSRRLDMRSTHYGQQGTALSVPGGD